MTSVHCEVSVLLRVLQLWMDDQQSALKVILFREYILDNFWKSVEHQIILHKSAFLFNMWCYRLERVVMRFMLSILSLFSWFILIFISCIKLQLFVAYNKSITLDLNYEKSMLASAWYKPNAMLKSVMSGSWVYVVHSTKLFNMTQPIKLRCVDNCNAYIW